MTDTSGGRDTTEREDKPLEGAAGEGAEAAAGPQPLPGPQSPPTGPASDNPADPGGDPLLEPPAAETVQRRRPAGPPDPAGTVEAILFSADKPLPAAKLSEIGELGGVRNVRQAVEALNARYERAGCVFRIVEIAGGFQMQTLPDYADVLARLHKSRTDSRLSQAAMETLAIVAYRQPALRADIEAIRGVACGEVLRGLLDRNLIRIAGRAAEIGRPLLYGTTKYFLEVFGLADLADLPNVEQLRMPAARPATTTPPAETPATPESPPAAPG